MDLSRAERELIERLREQAAAKAIMKARPPRVWLYIRWSHAESSKSGLTLDAQERLIREYANKLLPTLPKGTSIVAPLVDDAIRASKVPFRKRRAARIIWEGSLPGDIIVAYKLDRTFRNMADMATSMQKWAAQDIAVHFVRDNVSYSDANGRLFAHMLGAFAHFYSDQLSARCRDTWVQIQARGGQVGRPRVWETYTGERGWRKRIAIPKLWQAAVCIFIARKRHRWAWNDISDWCEALEAKEQGREIVWDRSYNKRTWPPRRCGKAAEEITKDMERDKRLRKAISELVASDIPLDQIGRHCPPPLHGKQ